MYLYCMYLYCMYVSIYTGWVYLKINFLLIFLLIGKISENVR